MVRVRAKNAVFGQRVRIAGRKFRRNFDWKPGKRTKFFTRRRWRVKIQIGQENENGIQDEEKENESRICDSF